MSHPDSDDEDARSFASAQTAFDMPEDQKHDSELDVKISDGEEHRLPPEEEKRLIQESHHLKQSANTKFAQSAYEEAILVYDRALASCPGYLDYDCAVLHSNIAACHVKLQAWEAASSAATLAVDCLERLDPMPEVDTKHDKTDGLDSEDKQPSHSAGTVQEVDDEVEKRILRLEQSGHTLDQVQKLRTKALLRRAKARTQIGSWSTLQGAEEDYKYLLTQPLAPLDHQTVRKELAQLQPRLSAAKDKEMAEVMGKLKGLGNSLLSPFGLSTNNFNFVKDETTGNYSMNFSQGGK